MSSVKENASLRKSPHDHLAQFANFNLPDCNATLADLTHVQGDVNFYALLFFVLFLEHSTTRNPSKLLKVVNIFPESMKKKKKKKNYS